MVFDCSIIVEIAEVKFVPFLKVYASVLKLLYQVIYNRETDQSRGFGFVTMSTVEEAEKAVELYNGYVSCTFLYEVLKFFFSPEKEIRKYMDSYFYFASNAKEEECCG